MFALSKVGESFRPPFSKGGAVEAAEASSRFAEREIFSQRFFLRTQTREAICGELASLFSFAPAVPKKKWGIKFVLFNELLFFATGFVSSLGNPLADFFRKRNIS